MDLLPVIGISVALVLLVMAGLGIKVIAGKKTSIRAGCCCGTIEGNKEDTTSCACGNENDCPAN